ncbi:MULTISPECIES: hypothetical protein [Planktothrix]|uniref:Transposase n=1 Tax=Planktothrix mougeotii LEGE 06226 TaxID=1828728 RepID=A0ABR9U6H3_9CYAN|nr:MULTISPECIES: hypothetical protein [Planktothrix]MBD2485408.1 hypothetical protein [Planktothrix sp. FACHB-1365]MBE9142068.1 hypothetical protein [Planktothrix mougeotii LEGE 06226]
MIGSLSFIYAPPQSARIVEGVCSPMSLSAIIRRLGIDQLPQVTLTQNEE